MCDRVRGGWKARGGRWREREFMYAWGEGGMYRLSFRTTKFGVGAGRLRVPLKSNNDLGKL